MSGKTILFIVAGGLILLGIIVCVIGFAVGGFSMESVGGGGDWEEKSFGVAPLTEEIQNIVIEDSNRAIIIEASSDDALHILVAENKYGTYESSTVDGTFRLTYRDNRKKWYHYVSMFQGWGTWDHPVRVQIPRDYAGQLNVETDNGKITLEDLTQLGDVSLRTSNGLVEISDVAAHSIKARTSNGAVNLDMVTATDAVEAITSNGRTSLTDVSAKDISAKTSNGAVLIDEIDAQNSISLRTSNGTIKGTIVGESDDFRITSDVDLGSNSLTNRGSRNAEKTLDASTSNGAIAVTFTKDD